MKAMKKLFCCILATMIFLGGLSAVRSENVYAATTTSEYVSIDSSNSNTTVGNYRFTSDGSSYVKITGSGVSKTIYGTSFCTNGKILYYTTKTSLGNCKYNVNVIKYTIKSNKTAKVFNFNTISYGGIICAATDANIYYSSCTAMGGESVLFRYNLTSKKSANLGCLSIVGSTAANTLVLKDRSYDGSGSTLYIFKESNNKKVKVADHTLRQCITSKHVYFAAWTNQSKGKVAIKCCSLTGTGTKTVATLTNVRTITKLKYNKVTYITTSGKTVTKKF